MMISPFAALSPVWSRWVSGSGHSVLTRRTSLGSLPLNPIVDGRSIRMISARWLTA